MRKHLLITTFLAIFLSMTFQLSAQVGINADGAQPDPSAMLDVKSTTTGMLIPRMTQNQISLIQNLADGLIVFCTTDHKFYAYTVNTNQWREISFGTGIIQPPFSCGNPVTINHVAGTVAPVSKTVTYGTVTNIPGATTKCWITSNLGADHQATAVNDATETSSGWYWQFNRKQGFKHDGTTRTPATTWIGSISETSDWVAANDPCTIELGSGWRIPTSTEWTNVEASGNWNDWTGPWNSALKLHVAGYLNDFNGSLTSRGYYGAYWNSTQYDDTNSWYLYINSGSCGTYYFYKASGFPLRCLQN